MIMKNRILYTELTQTIEHLSVLLRQFSGKKLYFRAVMFTRDPDSVTDDEPEIPDYFDLKVSELLDDDEEKTIINESGRIFHSTDDRGNELIRNVLRYKSEVAEDDTQS